SCDPPFFCQYLGYQPSGTLELEWAETDGNGAYRPDMKAVLFASYRTAFPRNGIAMAGGAVKARRTRVSRPVFSPGSQTQEIRADLTVYPGETAEVTVEIINHETLGVVKSLPLAGQASGTVLLTWDGRSSSGLLAAPGTYTVRTRAVGRFGETAVSDILMQVEY
ncbi:MAG: hypothetical protein L6R30_27110, partial [Thermoanaerobaculia bacterium]|nr:hypothetical protein [Thermoanaerobaculia bacterium]